VVLAGISVSALVAALLSCCALVALVGFAKWGGKKLARFFDSNDGLSYDELVERHGDPTER
jgi:hypothetical protein